ncbi:MAG: amidase family protein [Pseudomonadota bacterium]
MEKVASILAHLANGTARVEDIFSDAIRAAENNAQLNIYVNELQSYESANEHGVLAGVPFAVKDNIEVAGLPFTGGSAGLRSVVGHRDAASVALIRRAGAALTGKTNLHELAFGITSNNPTYGPVRNPYSPQKIAGGSSGGSAVAVATGAAAFALGTDTGGSGRLPAALCGVAGFRPTTGRYPTEGVLTLSKTRDAIAVFAQTAEDIGLIDLVLSGASVKHEAPKNLSGCRLGIPRNPYFKDLSSEVERAMVQTIELLHDAKVELVDVDMSEVVSLDDACGMPIAVYETVEALTSFVESRTDMKFPDFVSSIASPDVRSLLEDAIGEGAVPQSVYESCLNDTRPKLQAAYQSVITSHDLAALVLPASPATAPLIGQDETFELNGLDVPTFMTLTRNLRPTSVIGCPSISVPVCLGADSHMPVGVLFDGAKGQDRDVLAIAQSFESVRGSFNRPH